VKFFTRVYCGEEREVFSVGHGASFVVAQNHHRDPIMGSSDEHRNKQMDSIIA